MRWMGALRLDYVYYYYSNTYKVSVNAFAYELLWLTTFSSFLFLSVEWRCFTLCVYLCLFCIRNTHMRQRVNDTRDKANMPRIGMHIHSLWFGCVLVIIVIISEASSTNKHASLAHKNENEKIMTKTSLVGFVICCERIPFMRTNSRDRILHSAIRPGASNEKCIKHFVPTGLSRAGRK